MPVVHSFIRRWATGAVTSRGATSRQGPEPAIGSVSEAAPASGGEAGIRTLGARKGTPDFESGPFDQLRHLSERCGTPRGSELRNVAASAKFSSTSAPESIRRKEVDTYPFNRGVTAAAKPTTTHLK